MNYFDASQTTRKYDFKLVDNEQNTPKQPTKAPIVSELPELPKEPLIQKLPKKYDYEIIRDKTTTTVEPSTEKYTYGVLDNQINTSEKPPPKGKLKIQFMKSNLLFQPPWLQSF